MKPIDEVKKGILLRRYNIESISVDECLLLAIQAGETAKDIGPFDPAYTYFTTQAFDFENLALYIERTEHA